MSLINIDPTPVHLAVVGVVGAASWTVMEYGLHRFGMHELKGKGLASREHLMHHAKVTYFSSNVKKGLSALTTTVIVLPATWVIAGPEIAITYTTGMIGMYLVYEVLHRRIHTHAPRNKYGRWMRRSHFYHHFGGPKRNYGVTVNLWDRLMGTYDEPGVITVPRRHAPVWLLDENGDVRPEFADDYIVKGRPLATITLDDDARDKDDAFANRVPVLDDSAPSTRVPVLDDSAPSTRVPVHA